MSATLPFDALGVENALHDWVVAATGLPGDVVRFVQPWDVGVPRSAPTTVLIYMLGMQRIGEPSEVVVPQAMQARVTVIADGPGTVGVDFVPGVNQATTTISIEAADGDTPDVSAAALLLELQAQLPAGFSAVADPDDDASVLVLADAVEHVFAAAPVDETMTSVAVIVPARPSVILTPYRISYRIDFRTAATSGDAPAAVLMGQTSVFRRRVADPRMYALGFRPAGTLAEVPSIPSDRQESRAALDVAWSGHFTAAVANELMLQTTATLQIAS